MYSKKNIAIFLIIIIISSLGFKLLTVDFSIPFLHDDLHYSLRAIAHSSGDFAQSPKKTPGWPLFISPFYLLISSENFLDYHNVVRVLNLLISSITIFAVYLLGRKFFNEKYSLVMASLYAFEPHLNFISSNGYAEPLYHLTTIVAFYFILNDKKPKNTIIAFSLAAVAWWIRLNGFVVFLAMIIITILNYRKKPKLVTSRISIGVIFFLLIVSPMFIQRFEQYGDPLYFYWNEKIFAGDIRTITSENVDQSDFPTMSEYISKNGFGTFLTNFIFKGIFNEIDQIYRISFPYLIILLPIGILFSFRPFDQNKKFVLNNWIFILATLIPMIIAFSVVSERRFLYYLFPFLIIFATLPIQRLIEYGLSTFSFSDKQKNLSLLIIIAIVMGLSLNFTLTQFGIPDLEEENEKLLVSEFVINNLDGKLFEAGYTVEYDTYLKAAANGAFKDFKLNRSPIPKIDIPYNGTYSVTSITGNTIEEIIRNGESFNLRYIAVNEKGNPFFLPLNELYKNEKDFPYLIKIFDSDERKFNKFKVKIFEIDYEKFHELMDS